MVKSTVRSLFLVLALLFSVWGCAPPHDWDQPHGVRVSETDTSDKPDGVTPSQVFMNQWRVISLMGKDFPEASATKIQWIPCGEENSAYDPGENTIYLCTEMSEHPGAAILFAAHEMGHAVTTAYFSTHAENEADELGMLAMLRHGYEDELWQSADYYLSQDILKHIPGDPHPATMTRAKEAICLAEGYEFSKLPANSLNGPQDQACHDLYVGLVARYNLMFETSDELTQDELMDLWFKKMAKDLSKIGTPIGR